MPKPPPSPPSSDIEGVNRDARVGTPDKEHPDSGGAIGEAKSGGKARPEEGTPSE